MNTVVVAIAEGWRLTGSQKAGLDLAAAIDRLPDCRCVVVTSLEGPVSEAAEANGLQTVIVRAPAAFKSYGGRYSGPIGIKHLRLGSAALRGTISIAALMWSLHPDAVILNSYRSAIQWAIGVRLGAVNRVASIIRGPLEPAASFALVLRACSLLVAVSEDVRQELIERDLPTRSVVVHDPIAPSFGMDSPRRSKGDPMKRIGLVGSLVPRKGVHVAISVMSELERRGVPAVLEVVGDDYDQPYAKYVRQYAVNQGLDERVRFLGWRDDTSQLMAEWDVLLVPSLQGGVVDVPSQTFGANIGGEGLPRVLTEAGLAGLPAVVHDVNGADEYARLTGGAYVVKQGDIESAASAVEHFVGPSDLRNRVLENFSPRVVARELVGELLDDGVSAGVSDVSGKAE